MAEIRENLRYTREHEWLDETGRVGITDYAQDQLGDVVFVELPPVGTAVRHGESFGVVESVKSVSDLYSPADGEVVEVNDRLKDAPELVNEDPYGNGWLIRLRVDGEPDDLLDADQYRRLVEE
jgi:glycine cleavage system H protein